MAVAPSREYWDALAAGDYNYVFGDDRVQELLVAKLDLKTVTKLLKLLTQIVSQGIDDDFQSDDNIHKTIKHLLECITYQSLSVDVTIISCVYYISKYFISKGNVQLALNLKLYFRKFKIETSKDVLKVYYAYFYQLHTFVEQQNAILSTDMKLKIRYESLDVLSYCHVNYLHLLLNTADNFVNFDKISENPILHLQYAIRILKLTKFILKESIINENCETVCRCYAQFLSNLVTNILNGKNNAILINVLDDIEVLQTSSENCNKIMSFFVKGLKAIVNTDLSVTSIRHLTSLLQHLMAHESWSLLFSHCYRFASVFFSVHRLWLNSTTPFSLQEFMAVSEFAMLLSSCLKINITLEQTVAEPSSVVLSSFKVIISFISLGINTLLDCFANHGDVREFKNEVHEVLKQLIAIQTQCYELLMLLHRSGAQGWKDAWKIFAMRTVKLASVLERKEYFIQAYEFYQKLCYGYFELDPLIQRDESSISSEDFIYQALKGVCQCLVHQSKHEEALICTGIAVLLLPNNCRGFQRFWYLSKRETQSRNLNLQNSSIINYLQQQKIAIVFPGVSMKLYERLNSSTICRLLVWELESYMFNRREMYNSIYVAGRELMKNITDSLMFGEGIDNVLSSTWMKYDVSKAEFSAMYEKGIEVLLKLKEKVPNDHKWRLFLSLGNMHFYAFFAQVIALRKKLQNDVMEMKDQFPNNLKRKLMKGLIDPSEAEMKSNIITIYSDLNVEKEQELLDILVKAIEAWTNVHNSIENITESFQNKFNTLLLNLKIAAYVFALYGYHIHSLRSWMTYYHLCKLSGNPVASLLALSELLKFNSNLCDNELQKEANDIQEQIEKNNIDSKEKEVLFTYFLTKSSCCLINNECDVGWQYLQKVGDVSLSNTIGAQLIIAQKYLLLSKYYLHRHDFSEVPSNFEESNAFLSMIKALKILKAIYQIEKTDSLENCYLHLVMMEAAEWSGNLCLGMKLYRDGYAHLKTYLTLAQELGLASRCSQIVSKLVQFDIMCREVDNAEVKLLGLEAILCLTNVSAPSLCRAQSCPEEKLLSTSDNLCLDSEMIRMKLLDVATPSRNNFMASPELVKSPFKMPSIATHKEKCACLFCNSFLLHNSLVEVTLMKAQLHVLKGENDLALSYFKGGMTLCERLKIFQRKILNNFSKTIHGKSSDSYLYLSDPLYLSISKLFMSYGEFLFLCSHQEHVQNMINNSHDSLFHSQDCNLHIALEMIDIAQVLYSEINKIPSIVYGTCTSNDSERTNEQSSLPCSPKITGTPVSSRTHEMMPPVVHRNEDHLYLTNTLSPSVVVNLDTKLKSTEIQKKADKITKRGRKKVATHIDFNDLSVNHITSEVNDPKKGNVNGKFMKNGQICIDETIIINASYSDELDACNDEDIQILSRGLKDINISASKNETHMLHTTGKVSDVTSKSMNEGKHLVKHPFQKLKSKVKDVDITPGCLAECAENSEQATVQGKEFENVSVLGVSAAGGDLSPVAHRSRRKLKDTKNLEVESKNLMFSKNRSLTKCKLRSALFTDPCKSSFSSRDMSVDCCQNTLRELNLVTSTDCEKSINKGTRHKNINSKQMAPKYDVCTSKKESNCVKMPKSPCKIPVIIIESSDENSPESKCTSHYKEQFLSSDKVVSAVCSSSPDQKLQTGHICSERTTAKTQKKHIRNPCALKISSSNDTPASVKKKESTSAKKVVTRKKKCPFTYD